MRRIGKPGMARLAGFAMLLITGSAAAQSTAPPSGAAPAPVAPQLPMTAPQPRDFPSLQQRPTTLNNKPLFYLFGLPVGVSAPVAPPYCKCDESNFGGQPARSRSSVGRQMTGMGGL